MPGGRWCWVGGCRAPALTPASPHRFLSASLEGLLGSALRPEVAVPWSRGVREE